MLGEDVGSVGKLRMTRLSMFGLPVLLAVAAMTGLFSNDGGVGVRPLVVLDPGHGADELGGTGYGLIERDSNLDMAKRVGALLALEGIDVILTRADDGRATRDGRTLSDYSAIFADLDERIAIANEAKADLFISIHSNAYHQNPDARGIEVIYNPDRPFADRSRELAESLRAGIVAALEAHRYTAPPSLARSEAGMTDAAGRTTPFFVLGPERTVTYEEMDRRGGDWEALGYGTQASIQTRATQMPGVLLELLYMSNETDAALLKDDSARHYMAQGIAEGIKRALRAR